MWGALAQFCNSHIVTCGHVHDGMWSRVLFVCTLHIGMWLRMLFLFKLDLQETLLFLESCLLLPSANSRLE